MSDNPTAQVLYEAANAVLPMPGPAFENLHEGDKIMWEAVARAAANKVALERLAAAEARVRKLEDGLGKISALCPQEEPPPAFDEWGHHVGDSSDRHAWNFAQCKPWEVEVIARKALAKKEGRE